MSIPKLARGLLELPMGVSTTQNENSSFMNNLERTNALLVQFVSATENKRMMLRTELEESYFNLTIYNLRESIKHKIEQDMWNNLFKKHVSELQGKMKSRDKIEAAKTQSELSLFLDEAIGFYSKFLDILSLLHNIHLPGRQILRDKPLCKDIYMRKDNIIVDSASEQDMYYIVQHCFVHLGDLSRYHNLNKLARINYQLAVELNPQSGHAYNQLAILESSTMSQVLNNTNYSHLLCTILYYDYASSCQSPFPASRINLDSLLRRIHQESVSELLTSNNSTDDCISSLSVAWLHSYASMRLYNNIQRCRQLQQRIVEWASTIVKHHQVTKSHWRDLVTIGALQFALLSIYDQSKDLTEISTWNSNLQQFSQDLCNAICHGMNLISHDVAHFNSVLSDTGSVSIIILFMTWLNQYMLNGATNKCYLQRPFGEQFVKFFNILRLKIDSQSIFGSEAPIKLPTDLPELHYLSGYEPLKVPCKKFDIFLKPESKVQKNNNEGETSFRRGSFIIKVALRVAEQHHSLLTYDVIERQFKSVQVAHLEEDTPSTVAKKVFNVKRPVNVALSSFISKDILINNNISQLDKKSRSNIKMTSTQQYRNIEALSDVKLAKCIQEHIALETTHSLLSPAADDLIISTISKDESRAMAPAPGLILSSNLPADYKTMTAAIAPDIEEYQAPSQDLVEKSASPQTIHAKLHPYNPNREQFEKDLPPRFANKRSGSQKEINKSGFKSLNYWDSTNPSSNCETNLTKKESEMMMPPTVPSSWLSDNADNRHTLNNHVAMSPLNFQMTNSGNQRRTSFNNEPPQATMNMFQPSFQQFHKPAMVTDQECQMSHFLSQTTSSNLNNFSYHSSQHQIMDKSHMKLGSMFISPGSAAHSMHHNFPPIPPPPQQSHMSNMNPTPRHPQQTLNYDQFSTLSMNNCYDKPVFSTSNQSGFDYSSIITQQQPSPQQHQKYNHQVRSNNPLFNLLPGFMNEMQR